jgi:hypothetical protein
MLKFYLWAAYNAYVQMNCIKPHAQPGKRALTFNMSLGSLCEYLVAPEHKKIHLELEENSLMKQKGVSYLMYIMMLKGHPMQILITDVVFTMFHLLY